MSTPKSVSFESGHEELIHDAQFDYYGKRLATASSDRTIKIFEVNGDKQVHVADIKGHDGPVWQIAWAHPQFGSVLASCSYDGRVIVWKETQRNVWHRVYEHSRPGTSINAIAWAPHVYGLILAAAASDGRVYVHTHRDNNTWGVFDFLAHKGGCNAVSWGPEMKAGALLAHPQQGQALKAPKRLATGGCDNQVKVWRSDEAEGFSDHKLLLQGPGQGQHDAAGTGAAAAASSSHAGWVRDVAWAPSVGLPTSLIASASEDKTVAIWAEDQQGHWHKSKVISLPSKAWRVSWSVMGNVLAVSQADNRVSLWKEAADGEWRTVSTLGDKPAADPKEAKKEATL